MHTDFAFNIVNQMSFRVDSLQTLREMETRLKGEPGVTILGPITHGNALSLYFRDPEGNRVELLIDTPWHVPQPYRIPVDLSTPDKDLWGFIEQKARNARLQDAHRVAGRDQVEDRRRRNANVIVGMRFAYPNLRTPVTQAS